jgi:hypothetical protein
VLNLDVLTSPQDLKFWVKKFNKSLLNTLVCLPFSLPLDRDYVNRFTSCLARLKSLPRETAGGGPAEPTQKDKGLWRPVPVSLAWRDMGEVGCFAAHEVT